VEEDTMRARRRALTAGLVVLVALVLVGVYFGGRSYAGEIVGRLGEQGPSARVVDLGSVDQLRAAFNADAGTPRLLVLFSPT
jgi:hypothetical protein